MSELEKHCLVRDDDGHWYVIPVCMADRFRYLEETNEYQTFDDEFSSMAIGGSPSMVEFYLAKDIEDLFGGVS